MNAKVLGAVALVVIVLLGTFAFLSLNKSQQKTNAKPQTETQVLPSITGSESSEVMAEEVMVTLTTDGYSPAAVSVEKGTKVIWTNNSGADATVSSDPHPVHTNYAPLNLNKFGDGEALELVFNETGEFGYHNHFNAAQRGSVTVK